MECTKHSARLGFDRDASRRLLGRGTHARWVGLAERASVRRSRDGARQRAGRGATPPGHRAAGEGGGPSPQAVTVGILSDKSINAANAGNGEFYVTRGLLDRANDEQLRAIMAHEFAHNDLGHVAKAQRLQAGVAVGSAIIEQVIPNAAIITPIAGTLITRKYGRNEELEADKHGVTLLRRVGSSKESMVSTLTWLATSEGGGEGSGWFSTHPGTNDRIQALRQMP